MASKLKRISEPTEATIATMAAREGRTFVAQLDRIVDAGLQALGEDPVARDTHTEQPTAAAS